MRDNRFILEHRGGTLKKTDHYLLMEWACRCAEHVLYLADSGQGSLLENTLETGRRWTRGEATVGEARKAAVAAHAEARRASSEKAVAIARAAGHAAATAHMADHAPGAAYYALRAIKSAGMTVEDERAWQVQQLPPQIRDLVLSFGKKLRV